MKKRIRFIVNPISGVGKQKLIEKLVSEHLDARLFESEIIYTRAKGHGTELAKEAAREMYDIVVAVGGDGSVNEIGRALTESNTALAIVPSGSGNGFARHLRIPVNLGDAVRLLNDHVIQTVDTWKLNEEFFLNVAGTGFDAHITRLFATHGKRGLWSYVKLILREFRNYTCSKYVLTLDTTTHVETEAFLVTFANGTQYGNNAFVNRKANTADGTAEICVLKKFPLWAAPGIAFHTLRGGLSGSAYCDSYRANNIRISQQNDHMHVDGDAIHSGKEIRISCQPLSLKVVTGKTKQ